MLTVDAYLLQFNRLQALIHRVVNCIDLDIITWVNVTVIIQVQVDLVRASCVLTGIDDVCSPLIDGLEISSDTSRVQISCAGIRHGPWSAADR